MAVNLTPVRNRESELYICFWSIFCEALLKRVPLIKLLTEAIQKRVTVVAINLDGALLKTLLKGMRKTGGFSFTLLLMS